jgi:hypothetical protein
MAEKSPTWLVWVNGPRGPSPQIWFDDGGRFVGPSDLTVLQRNKVSAIEAECCLDNLAKLYPLSHEEAA